MDGRQFDSLTRRLAGSLPRRRLLQRAAGVLAGMALPGGVAPARAQTCNCPPNAKCCPDGVLCCAVNNACCE